MRIITILALALILTGCFDTKTVEITSVAGHGGSVHPSSKRLREGSTTVFTVVPEEGYRAASVEGCAGVLTGSSYKTGKVDANCTITAYFTEDVLLNVDAGQNLVVEAGSEVPLAGSVNIDESFVSRWEWTQITGAPIELKDADKRNTNFIAPEVGQVEVRLTVTTKAGTTASDDVLIEIDRPASQLLVANAGFDQFVDAGEKIYISGANSHDSDGQITSYEWTQISGSAVTLEDFGEPIAHFFAPVSDDQETLVFELTVTDDSGNSASDRTSVLVGGASEAPGAATLISASSLDPHAAELNWLAARSDSPPEDIVYTVHLSRTPHFLPHGGTALLQVEGEPSARLGALTPDTHYFAKIEAHVVGSRSSWSNELSFTTASTAPELNATLGYKILNTTSQGILIGEDFLEWELGQDEPAPEIGDVLVGEDDSSSFLRVAQSISRTGNTVSVSTLPASLAEVYKELSFSASIHMPPAMNLPLTTQAGGSSLATSSDDVAGQDSNRSDSDSRHEKSNQNANKLLKSHDLSSAPANAADQQVHQDGPLSIRSVKAIVVQPGERVRINVSADTSENSEFIIGSLELLNVIPPDGMQSLAQGTALGEYVLVSDFSDNGNYRQKRQFNWVPGRYQVDQKNADPYLLVFKADAMKQNCGRIELGCRRSVSLTVSVYLEFDEPSPDKLSFSTSGTASFSGDVNIDFSPNVTANAVITDGALETAGVTVNGMAQFDLSTALNAAAGASAEGEKVLFRRRFARVFMGGPIPIVVVSTVELRGEFSATAQANVELEQNYNHRLRLSAGVVYNRTSGWSAIKESEPSYSFTVKGEADGAAAINVKIVPDIKVSFYGSAMGHMKLEPYLFGEVDLEGKTLFEYDSITTDWDSMYRFQKLDVGGGVDVSVRADFSVLDHVVAGWPSRDIDEFNVFKVVPRSVIYGLPKLELEEGSCGLSATLEDSTVTKANGFVLDSTLWRAFPNNDPNYVIRLLPKDWEGDSDSASQSAFVCVDAERAYYDAYLRDYKFDVRIGGSAEAGNWLQMYAELEDIQIPYCPQKENLSPEDANCSKIYVAEHAINSGFQRNIREYDLDGVSLGTKASVQGWNIFNFGLINDEIYHLYSGLFRNGTSLSQFEGWAEHMVLDNEIIYLARIPNSNPQVNDVLKFGLDGEFLGQHRTLNYWATLGMGKHGSAECYIGFEYGNSGESTNSRLYLGGEHVYNATMYYGEDCAVDDRWAYFLGYTDGKDPGSLRILDHNGNVKQELTVPSAGVDRLESDGKFVAITQTIGKKVLLYEWLIEKDSQGNVSSETLVFKHSFDTIDRPQGVLVQ